MSPTARRTRWSVGLAALAVLAAGVGLWRFQAKPPAQADAPTALGAAPFFQVVRVDDDLELHMGDSPLPEVMSTGTENLPDGPERLFFKVAVPPGMNNPQARKQGNDWIAANVKLPDDDAVAWGVPTAPGEPLRSYWLRGAAVVDSHDLQSVVAQAESPNAPPILTLAFNAEGTESLKQATANWRGGRLAMVLDGAVLSAPLVEDEIDNGQLTLGMGPGASLGNAQALAAALMAGR